LHAEIAKTPIRAIARSWDNGFRHITSATREIRTAEDLKGFKIRVPVAPILTSLFQALEARPAAMNFNEVYAALQTKVVEGQENALPIISTTRLYEVQQFCSLTAHVWDGYWMLAHERAWERLPPDVREIVTREFDRSGADQRADVAKLSQSLRQDLTAEGLRFIGIDRESFRQALAKTSFYADWKERFGAEAWTALEKTTGRLA
jgi:TRAP-type C4-dicarboxylate transport system substrate-binding protein